MPKKPQCNGEKVLCLGKWHMSRKLQRSTKQLPPGKPQTSQEALAAPPQPPLLPCTPRAMPPCSLLCQLNFAIFFILLLMRHAQPGPLQGSCCLPNSMYKSKSNRYLQMAGQSLWLNPFSKGSPPSLWVMVSSDKVHFLLGVSPLNIQLESSSYNWLTDSNCK